MPVEVAVLERLREVLFTFREDGFISFGGALIEPVAASAKSSWCQQPLGG